MLVNPQIGEVHLIADGEEKRLRLTLGALAGLENALGADSLNALVARLAEGELSAADLIAVLDAGLIGGGQKPGIANMEIEGGASAAARAVVELFIRAFPRSDMDDAL